jgi:hypothetical protein
MGRAALVAALLLVAVGPRARTTARLDLGAVRSVRVAAVDPIGSETVVEAEGGTFVVEGRWTGSRAELVESDDGERYLRSGRKRFRVVGE